MNPSTEVLSNNVDIRNVKFRKKAITVDQVWLNINKGETPQFASCPNLWHRFHILDVYNNGRNTVLKDLVNFVFPCDLLPIYYTRCKKGAYFLSRNCQDAINKLCENRLIIPNSKCYDKPYVLEIVINIKDIQTIKVIDAQANVTRVLEKRFINGELDLQSFWDDPDLEQFCPLSQPKFLTYVLQLSRRLNPEKINLENNDLQTIEPLTLYSNGGVTELNLRHNKIPNLVDVRKGLKDFKFLTNIWLDGNPLCGNVTDPVAYTSILKDICPTLQCIDGVSVLSNTLQSKKKTFLCDRKAEEFVDQFLTQFFTLYDKDRFKLVDMYDKYSSLFSLSYHLVYQGHNFPEPAHFKYKNRNILMDRSSAFLYRGSNLINSVFQKLAETCHNPLSFMTDLMYYTNDNAVINVSGSFKENQDSNCIWYGFNRTFRLRSITITYESRWVITNDILNIIYPYTNIVPEPQTKIWEPVSRKNYAELEKTFVLITNLTKEFARTFLEERMYDLKASLRLFCELHKNGSLPDSAFQQSNSDSDIDDNKNSETKFGELSNSSRPNKTTNNIHNQTMLFLKRSILPNKQQSATTVPSSSDEIKIHTATNVIKSSVVPITTDNKLKQTVKTSAAPQASKPSKIMQNTVNQDSVSVTRTRRNRPRTKAARLRRKQLRMQQYASIDSNTNTSVSTPNTQTSSSGRSAESDTQNKLNRESKQITMQTLNKPNIQDKLPPHPILNPQGSWMNSVKNQKLLRPYSNAQNHPLLQNKNL